MLSNLSPKACYLLFAFMLASCLSVPAEPNSPLIAQSLPETPTSLTLSCVAPLPRPGKASLCGVLRSTYMDPPEIPKTAFYLTQAVGGEPPFILTGPNPEVGDIQGTSDEVGKILLENIAPGYYYLAVWAPYNWILAVQSTEDMTPRLFIIEPDQQYHFDIIYVPWP